MFREAGKIRNPLPEGLDLPGNLQHRGTERHGMSDRATNLLHRHSVSTMRYLYLWLALSLVLQACNNDRMVNDGEPVEKVAPTVPALASPPEGALNEPVPIFFAWDSSAGAQSYQLQVSRNSGFTDIIYIASGLTSTSRVVPGLADGTQYWWRVNATGGGRTSDWSPSRNFYTYALAVPEPDAPIDNATDQTPTTTFTWNPAPDATSYQLQVSTERTFTDGDRFVVNDSGLTSTSRVVPGLDRTSVYYWRVRAKSAGLYSKWSATRTFQTIGSCKSPSAQVDGEFYETVSIKGQCWLRRNLNAGTMIAPGVTAVDNDVTEKFCFDNDPANCETYGGLYSWDEAMQYSTAPGAQGICPDGWRLPTRADIETLAVAVSDTSLARNYVAAEDGGTDLSGFSARLAGYYDFGYFGELGDVTKFWISEKDNAGRAYYWILGRTGFTLVWIRADEHAGYSIRCIAE